MQLHVPWEKVHAFASAKGYGDLSVLKPRHRSLLLSCSDVEIVLAYNAELRGFANYYALAKDVSYKLNRLEFLQRWSLFKTLASKHKTNVRAVVTRMRTGQEFTIDYDVDGQPRSAKVWKLAHLKRDPATSSRIDIQPWTQVFTHSRTDWVDRQNAKQCEACGRSDIPCQVHHIRGMADVSHRGFVVRMKAARARRTVVLCEQCHRDTHAGRLPDQREGLVGHSGEPHAVKAARAVRRGDQG